MATAMTNDSPVGSGDTCPFCDATDLECEHVALMFVPSDRISGGLADDEAQAFLEALDEALVEAAKNRKAGVRGACRALCLEAAKLARRREDRVEPEDVPCELDLARWELLDEILARVPGTEVRDCQVEYGGFAAEDSGRVAYALDVERVGARLRAEMDAFSR